MSLTGTRLQTMLLVVVSWLYPLTVIFFIYRDTQRSHSPSVTSPSKQAEASSRFTNTLVPFTSSVEEVIIEHSPYELDHKDDSQLLDPKLSVNSVFYVWCGRRWFEFHHYISVLSVMKFIRPDQLIFFYDVEPVVDHAKYNTWLKELQQDYPFLRMSKLLESENGCLGSRIPNEEFIDNMLYNSGGIYVNEHTIFTRFPLNTRYMMSFQGFTENQTNSFELRQRGTWRNLELLGTHESRGRVTCPYRKEHYFISIDNNTLCLTSEEIFYPKDIWKLDTQFGRLVRLLFYKSSKIPEPNQTDESLIPNIAHMIWLGGGQMDFMFYLCVLSILYVAEVDALYIHGDGPPTGQYWDKVKDNSRLKLIYREHPRAVYGTQVNVTAHVTDIWRVDLMIKYGGIYVDTDTIWTQKLSRHIRSYDAVGAYDWPYWNQPFPDIINFGVAIGKKGASFWQQFQKSMEWFVDKDWSWNGLRQPYKIKERHPELLHIDPHLQVICYRLLCHPTWRPDYHNGSLHHVNTPIQDWRTETHAFHFTYPVPKEFSNLETLKKHNGTMFGEIGMNVIKRAGLST